MRNLYQNPPNLSISNDIRATKRQKEDNSEDKRIVGPVQKWSRDEVNYWLSQLEAMDTDVIKILYGKLYNIPNLSITNLIFLSR